MGQIIYYPGGYEASAPAQNMAEQWDDATSTVTTWDTAGNVTSTRPYTAAETTAAAIASNGSTLRQAATNAIANNQTFLGIASPTAAQELSQLEALTRQVNALIRLVTSDLSSTAGT